MAQFDSDYSGEEGTSILITFAGTSMYILLYHLPIMNSGILLMISRLQKRFRSRISSVTLAWSMERAAQRIACADDFVERVVADSTCCIVLCFHWRKLVE